MLLLTGHLGNFELGARAMAVLGYPVSAVARPLRNTSVYRHIRRLREDYGVAVIDKRRAATGILRALRQGRVVFVLNDQYSRRSRAVFAPLFGLRCSTSAGLAILALRSGAPVVTGHMFRDATDHHTALLEPLVEVPRTGDRSRDVLELTTRCNAALEAMIRKHPKEWIWNTRRFRHSPDVEGNPYLSGYVADTRSSRDPSFP